jgi:glucan endo-1,3-alpha-glucosidase
MRFSLLCLAGVAASTVLRPKWTQSLNSTETSQRKVFAHYMVGDTYGQELAQWQTDVADAKSAGIDGFALNIGLVDYNTEQLDFAYEAASSVDDFVLFISFDMSVDGWTVEDVASFINDYKNSTSQFKMNGLPFVSTFEGPTWASNWTTVNASTGGIFFVPDWSSQGAVGATTLLPSIDGACKYSRSANWSY